MLTPDIESEEEEMNRFSASPVIYILWPAFRVFSIMVCRETPLKIPLPPPMLAAAFTPHSPLTIMVSTPLSVA